MPLARECGCPHLGESGMFKMKKKTFSCCQGESHTLILRQCFHMLQIKYLIFVEHRSKFPWILPSSCIINLLCKLKSGRFIYKKGLFTQASAACLPNSPLPFRNLKVEVAASETNNAEGLWTKRGAALALLLQNSAALLPGWMNSCGNSPEQAEKEWGQWQMRWSRGRKAAFGAAVG